MYLSGGEVLKQDNAAVPKTEPLTAVSVYDYLRQTWTEAPPMNSGRSAHATCCLDDRVYVFAGKDNDGSIESYQIGGLQGWVVIM